MLILKLLRCLSLKTAAKSRAANRYLTFQWIIYILPIYDNCRYYYKGELLLY